MPTDRGAGVEGRGDVTGRLVPTNGVETYSLRRGAGPPVVFIHGLVLDHGMWTEQATALADAFTTVAYDVRGHGRTGGSDVDPYSVGLFAADRDALLTALELERPVGGCLAQAYAAAHPANVAGLVLVDTFPPGPIAGRARLLFANLRVLARLDRIVRYKRLNRLQTRIGNLLAPGVAGDGERLQRRMDESPTISHMEFKKIARATAAFATTRADLSEVRAPTLVLYGEHVPELLRELALAIPTRLGTGDVDIEAVPDAGHASSIDNPAVVTDRVRAFATKVTATGA